MGGHLGNPLEEWVPVQSTRRMLVCTILLTGLGMAVNHAPALEGNVIRFGWDIPDAHYLARHAEEMERSGLDGVVVDFTRRFTDEQGKPKEESVRSRRISSRPVRLAEIQHNITALKGARFRRFTDNFLCMYANSGPGGPECFFKWDRDAYPRSPWKNWPDDPCKYLNTFRDNMVLAARVCRQLGLKGFFIDQEMYGSWTQMRSDWPMEVFQEPLETIMAGDTAQSPGTKSPRLTWPSPTASLRASAHARACSTGRRPPTTCVVMSDLCSSGAGPGGRACAIQACPICIGDG